MSRYFLIVLLISCGTLAPDNPYPATASRNFDSWIRPDQVQYHSRVSEFRSPKGPVPLGQSIQWKIKTQAGAVEKVTLLIQDEFIEGNQSSVTWSDLAELTMSKVAGELWDEWVVSYLPEYAGTLGYYFLLEKGTQSVTLGNNLNKVSVPWVEVIGTNGTGRLGPIQDMIPFRMTVYLAEAQEGPPEDLVYYYIFPDRFRNGNRSNDPQPGRRRFYNDQPIEFHAVWNDPVPFKPGDERSDPIWNNDFYGGDLEGIIEKLDHIRSLGTTMIYMTPIFYAMSNHKYDTADYMTIDPMFGNMEVFKRLVREAANRGMGIMLDTSLNHSGADSIYFDRWGKWPGVGAFENESIRTDSPYYSWYSFNPSASNPDQRYKQWANPSLAELAETESWKDFAYRQPNSVSLFWLSAGAAGWRMDVVPWVSDEFWIEWRSAIRSRYPKALLVSETWFVAAKYLLGTMFDGTMNYVFRGAALDFARGGSPRQFQEAFEMLEELYPPQALRRSMNLISSHDVPRALHQLGYRKNSPQIPQEVRARFLLAVALQYLLPGAPTIYYGDEVGVTGGEDPLNRGPFPWPDTGANWGDWTLMDEYRKLAKIRQEYADVILFGTTQFLDTPGLLTLMRQSSEGKVLIVTLNNSDKPLELRLPGWDSPQVIPPLSFRVF